MPAWLRDAIFYEIYPQSFRDTNGDGIGDFAGIIEKLDYIRELGANALWINPCFDSPFKDAGYDVRDYKKAAPRYGTNDDLVKLFDEVHARGMHVLLDLVPGHTSEEHHWFKESGKAQMNEFSGRYVWSDFWLRGMAGHPYIAGECERNGAYMLNFFKCQPALNYGFLNPTESWMSAMDSPEALATRDAIWDVMDFWLGKGCDGFRVDMAPSLVKDDDEEKSGTCRVWQDLLGRVRKAYPEAALVSEWSCPHQAVACAGFDMDFYLDHPGNGYNSLMRDFETPGDDRSYFRKDAGSDISHFLGEYLPELQAVKGKGYISLLTCNHDTPRPEHGLSTLERKLAYSFLFTMPGVPFLYYGDEVGMRYIEDLPTHEGGYTRTGSRTPMQWDETANHGFSAADAAALYLPTDPAPAAPTVKAAMADPDSLYHTLKTLFALRHEESDLQADGDFEVLYAEKGDPLFVYRRGALLAAVNPSGTAKEATLTALGGEPGAWTKIYSVGDGSLTDGKVHAEPQSFVLFRK